MTENKTILLRQIYNDSCSLFEKVNEDLKANEDLNENKDIKNIILKIYKNPTLQQKIFYDFYSLLDKMDNGNDDLYQEFKNITRKFFKNPALRETCNDIDSLFDKLKGNKYFHQEFENINTKFAKLFSN